MRAQSGIARWVLLLGILLVQSLPASAALEGVAMIVDKQPEASTVVLDGRTFVVTERTVLLDAGGHRTSLGALPTLRSGARADDAAVYFEASDGNPPTLDRLQLTGEFPR